MTFACGGQPEVLRAYQPLGIGNTNRRAGKMVNHSTRYYRPRVFIDLLLETHPRHSLLLTR